MTLKKFLRFIFVLTFVFLYGKNDTISYTICYAENILTYNIDDTSETIDFNHFYYSQLTDIEKEIYDNLVNSKEKFLNDEDIIFKVTSYTANNNLTYYEKIMSIRKATKAYSYDNPEVDIWFDNFEKSFIDYSSNDYLFIKLKPKTETNATLNSSNIREALTNFESISSDFVSTLSGTDIEKLKKINNWLIDRCNYDATCSLPNTRTAYGTIVEGRSICSGYAYSFKYLADLAGLDVLYVTGKYYNEPENSYIPHAWNVVLVNNEYFVVDVTSRVRSNFLIPLNTAIYNYKIDNLYFSYPF